MAEPFNLDDFLSLEKADRDALAELVRGPYLFSDRRQTPARFVPLTARGLAFHAHGRVSITAKGLEVAERVT